MDRSVLSRLKRLEHQNRVLKLVAVGPFILVLVILLMGQTSGSTRTAGEFLVTDARGRTRATLGFDDTGQPGLCLYDADGRPRLLLSLEQAQPSIMLYAADGYPRVGMDLDRTTSRVAVFRSDGVPQGLLGGSETGATVLLLDQDNNVAFQAP